MALLPLASISCRVLQRGNTLTRIAKHNARPVLSLAAPIALEPSQRRHFSTERREDAPPPEGLDEVFATLDKVRSRRDLFKQYKQQDVFAPSSISWLANWLMFYHLNRPQTTQVDLLEFIQGAKHAMQTTMTAMYSREFAAYVEREAGAPGSLEPDCEAAELVHRSLETVSYEAFKSFVLKSASAGIRAEMKEIEIHSAHLLSVQYERAATRSTTNSSGAKVLGVPMLERLKLAVLFDITEHVSVALPDSEGAEDIAVRRNKVIWQFESGVTTPENIDWIIEPLQLVA
jgi:hypothetical protein